MTTAVASISSALQRVEALYAGELGVAYTWQHARSVPARARFWGAMAAQTRPTSLLEVGCGSGGNLAQWPAPAQTGVDVAPAALGLLRENVPQARGVRASAGALPFRDGAFDLVLTCGTLIHVPEDALPGVLDEVARVARRWVLLVEYDDVRDREIPWRGQRDVLWARPFGLAFWRRHPEFAPAWRQELARADGFDACTAALFRRREDPPHG